MKITREKASQRLHHRVKTPLDVKLDGYAYTASDWGMGGFRVSNWDRFEEEFKATDRFPCYFKLPFQGFDIAFDIEVELVRVDATHKSASFKFVELSDRQVELLNHFVEQLVRGAMVPIGDTILRIDSPVTPVSTKPDPSPVQEIPVSRWPVKLIGMSVFYILVGLTLFGYVGLTLYENILSLKVDTAITATPVEPLVSLVDGRIEKVNANLDEVVAKGKVLIKIDSPDLKKSIDDAKNKLELKKLELEALRKRYQVSIDTTGSQTSKESRLIEIEIDLMKQEVTLATQSVVNLYEYQENLSIESPGNGRLISLMRNNGSSIKSGETIGLFERTQLPRIHAYVTEVEASGLTISQKANVHILSLDIQWPAKVVQIRPDKAFLNHEGYQYRPASESVRSVLVELELLPSANPETLRSLRSGLPVVVLFPASKLKKHLPQTLKALWNRDTEESEHIVPVTSQRSDLKQAI